MRYLVIAFGLLLWTNNLIGQDNKSQKIKITINQVCLPGPNPDLTYKLTGRRFTILKTQSILWQKAKITNELFFHRLNKEHYDSLKLIINHIDLSKLENSYFAPVMDGVIWDFTIRSNGETKKIILHNYYLPELGLILDFLNRQLPKDERYISFDIFGIRKEFKK